MNVKLLKNNFNIVNEKIMIIVKNGIKLAMFLCLVAVLILTLYCEKANPQAFYIGISLLKSALFFIAMFIICGYIFDRMVRNKF